MGVVYETIQKNKGKIIGIIPQLLNKKSIRQENTKNLIIVKNMSIRKKLIIEKSDIIIIFPGGYGTLDELFEVLTINQLKIATIPIIILNINNYWNPLKILIRNAQKEGFISKIDLSYIHWINDSKNILDTIKKLT